MVNYPKNILPHDKRLLLTIDDILDGKLIRFTEENPYYDDEFGIYNKAIANPSFTHMPDLSCSLLSNEGFKKEYITLKIINPDFLEYCNPNTSVEIPIFEKDYEINQNRFPYYLIMSEIHNLQISYKKNEDLYEATCYVNHTPMKWNYWHFSVNWFINSEDEYWHKLPEEIKKKTWSKERLAHSTRDLIRAKAIVNLD